MNSRISGRATVTLWQPPVTQGVTRECQRCDDRSSCSRVTRSTRTRATMSRIASRRVNAGASVSSQSPVLGPLGESSYSLRHVGDAALSAITMPWGRRHRRGVSSRRSPLTAPTDSAHRVVRPSGCHRKDCLQPSLAHAIRGRWVALGHVRRRSALNRTATRLAPDSARRSWLRERPPKPSKSSTSAERLPGGGSARSLHDDLAPPWRDGRSDRRKGLPLAGPIAILLTLASFVPWPIYTQCFCMPLPFLLVSAVASARRSCASTRHRAYAMFSYRWRWST
jgi:hypothetical protein